MVRRIFSWLKRYRVALLLLCIIVGLTLIPTLFWGPYHLIGGDDTRLYYLFTTDYLKNYATNLFTGVHIGGEGFYYPIISNWPLAATILVIKTIIPFLSPDLLMFGLNLGIGFWAFYCLLDNFVRRDHSLSVSIKIVAALSYCLSNFLYFTVYGALWPALFLVSIAPLFLHLFIKGLKNSQTAYVVLSSVVAALFANILTNLAWFSALMLSLSPLFLYLLFRYRRQLIKHLTIFIVLFVLMSAYWLVHIVAAPLNTSEGDNNPVARVGKQLNSEVLENDQIINAVAGKNEVMYPMLGAFHKSILTNFKWTGLEEYKHWTLPLLFLSSIFIMVIAGAAVPIAGEERRLYIAVLSSWLLSLYLFTVHITTYGMNLFLILSRYIPGFSMFRNMYDKFGLAMAFTSALLIAISLQSVTEKRSRDILGKVIVSLCLLVVLINARTFVQGNRYKDDFRSTYYKDTITDFTPGFYQLMSQINSISDDSRIVWLPFSSGNYIPLKDASEDNHYYAGPSPVKILTNKNDLTGTFSIYPRGDTLTDLLLRGQYAKAAQILKEAGVGYVVVNHDVEDSDWKDSYLYSVRRQRDLYQAQGDRWKQEILGEKVGDYGNYSLYNIREQYHYEKIFSTGATSYRKLNDTKFEAELEVTGSQPMYMLEPYHKLWRVYLQPISGDGQPVEISRSSHSFAFDYANQWTIDTENIISSIGSDYYRVIDHDSISVSAIIEFVPASWSPYLNGLSLFVLISSTVYALLILGRASRKTTLKKLI